MSHSARPSLPRFPAQLSKYCSLRSLRWIIPGKRWKTIALKTDYLRIKKSFPKYQRYKLLHLADIIRLFVRRKVIIWIWTKVKTLSCNNRTLHALKLQKVTTALPSTTNLKKKRWSKFNPPYQYKEVFSIWCKYLSDFRQKVMICIGNPCVAMCNVEVWCISLARANCRCDKESQ